MKPLICPNCNELMLRRKSRFKNQYWWGCPNFPICDIRCSENPDGTIMSLPADSQTRELRKEAHKLCELIWGKWEEIDRTLMYAWLGDNTRTGHIGTTNKSELASLIKKLKKLSLKKKKC